MSSQEYINTFVKAAPITGLIKMWDLLVFNPIQDLYTLMAENEEEAIEQTLASVANLEDINQKTVLQYLYQILLEMLAGDYPQSETGIVINSRLEKLQSHRLELLLKSIQQLNLVCIKMINSGIIRGVNKIENIELINQIFENFENSIAQKLISFNHQRFCQTRETQEPAWQNCQESLEKIILVNPNGIIILDSEGRVIFVNRAAELLFNRTALDLLGENLGIPIVVNNTSELEIPQDNGELKVAQMRVVEIVWDEQDAYLVSLNDITDLKKTQENLKILYQATEQSPVSVVITDAQGNIEYVNPKFEEITGYTMSEVIGKNPRILKSGIMSEEEYKILWQNITSGDEWHGEFHNRRKNGELFWEAASISPIRNEAGIITHFVGIKEDITRRKEQESILTYQANYDALTNLPNRFLAIDRLRQALVQAERNKKRVAVIFIDLDHFKNINDTLGHEYGDLLLIQASERLLKCLRKSDTVARLGGDEFLVIISDLEAANQCKSIASKIMKALSKPFSLEKEEAFISASIGISIYPDDGRDVSDLMRNADAAMYEGKRGGRNTFIFYTTGMNEITQRRLRLENALRWAIEKEELHLVYQPKIDLKTTAIVGAEALVRWHSSELGQISPENFIPIAEETGLISGLGAWVFRQTCMAVSKWQKKGLFFSVGVNLSPRQFRDPSFLPMMRQVIMENGLHTSSLELEITEKLLIEEIPGASELIHQLHQLNFDLSIDDFGTGYSSLSYLVKFPFQGLKIDKSFIAGIPHNREYTSLVRAIIAMAHGLNLTVLAEGVETLEQVEFLQKEGCDHAQGYYFSYPLNFAEFTKYVEFQPVPNPDQFKG